MRAVHVGVGHDHDLVVADLRRRRSPVAIPVPSAVISVRISAEASILSRRAFSTFRILPRSGRIAWKRRSRPCLAEPPARVALDDEDLGERRVLLLAVGELAGQRARVERALAPHELAGLARRLAGPRGLDDLLDDLACRRAGSPRGRSRASRRRPAGPSVLTSEETSLSLVCEENFGSWTLTETTAVRPSRQSSPERLVSLRALVRPLLLGVLLDRARQRRLEALEVRAAVAVVDRVGEGEDRLGVAVVPLQRDLDALLVGVALGVAGAVLDVLEEDDLVVDRLLRLVQVLDEGPDAALVGEVVLLLGALVADRDRDAGIQERELAQPLREAVEVELR